MYLLSSKLIFYLFDIYVFLLFIINFLNLLNEGINVLDTHYFNTPLKIENKE